MLPSLLFSLLISSRQAHQSLVASVLLLPFMIFKILIHVPQASGGSSAVAQALAQAISSSSSGDSTAVAQALAQAISEVSWILLF